MFLQKGVLLLQEQMVAPLNKSGSDTLPLRKRSDFKQELSTLERLHQKLEKNHSCPLILTSTNNGSRHRVRPLHGGNGKIPGGLLNIQKVKEEASKVLEMNGETRRRWLSRVQFILLQLDRLQLTAVHCNRRGV